MLIAFYVMVIGLVIVASALLIDGAWLAIVCAVSLAVLVLAFAILIRYRSARRICPACGANHPRLEGVISDGGEWECRKCGNTWK